MKIVRLGAKQGYVEIVDENGEVIEVLFDYTLCWMIKNNIKLTRENWLSLNYCGDDGNGENLEGENLAEFLEISEFLSRTRRQ